MANQNTIEGCSKEQPAGAEVYVCGTPNKAKPDFPWYCRKCSKKYVSHLEQRVAFLEDAAVCKVSSYIEGLVV